MSVHSIIDGSLHGEASRDQILCYGTGIGLACMGPEWPFVCFTRGMNLKASQSDPSVQICVVCRNTWTNQSRAPDEQIGTYQTSKPGGVAANRYCQDTDKAVSLYNYLGKRQG